MTLTNSPHATAPAASISAVNYAFLQKYIYAQSGIVLDATKQYLLEARLLPILRNEKIASLDDLSELLAKRPLHPVASQVVEAMTTNETLFFRDVAMFDALRAHLLPSLFGRSGPNTRVRIWSAASSTGQEAYSIAMLLLEMGKTRAEVEILGTDLSHQVLDRARQGRYVQFEVNRGLPSPLLMKYFTPVGMEWQLNDQVRSLVRFEPLDLRSNLQSLGMFDLVLCRNVLIYFDPDTKKKIVDAIASVMTPGAALALGCAENVINMQSRLRRSTLGQSTFYLL